MDNSNMTSGDVNAILSEEQSSSMLIKTGLAAGAAYGLNTALNKWGQEGSYLGNFYNGLLGTDYLKRQLEASDTWTKSGSTLYTGQGVKKSLLSQLLALEEISPLHILRTLQLGNLLQPFVDITQAQQEVVFTKRKLRNQEHFYKTMLEFANKDMEESARKAFVSRALTEGMIYKGGKLYGLKTDGSIDTDTVFAKHARIVLSNIKQGEVNSPNLMVTNYSKAIGATFDLDKAKFDPVQVVGADSNLGFINKWAQGWARYAMETGMKSLDDPAAGFEETLRSVGVDQTSFFESKYWKGLKKYTGKLQLGTNGDYDLTIKESLARSGKNIGVKTTKAVLGYEIADSVLRTIAPSDGLFSEGIYTGLTNIFASANIAFAEAWSDKFQGYKEKQEQIAPGSTSLTTLAALPLSGALLGAQLAYGGRMTKTALTNTDEAAKIYNTSTTSEGLSSIGLDKKYKPMKGNALKGAVAGAALALPFLPGALIGSSSEELRDLYSGEKEVAQKANRWWMFGGGAWEGTHTQYYTQHNVARVNADATDKVRYGDDDTKKKLNPFLHPLAYIKDPYRYEKMHAQDMPYPVWGMDVNYGSIYGKVFERTVGQIIKPDVINPAIYDTVETTLAESSSKAGMLLKVRDVVFGNKDKTRGTIQTGQSYNPKDKQLIGEGLLLPEQAASYNPNVEAGGLTYQSLTDLVGLKGWTASLTVDALGLDPRNQTVQLARSGEATSEARDLVDSNLGDLFGFGEFQRKILGTSSGSLPDRLNPLTNEMPSWLPNTDNQYYINFKKGNPYSHIKNGEERLPGVGYAALNPEVQGVDPEDYSLVHKYKILSDVAKGSREHIRARQQVLSAYAAGDLSRREIDIVGNTLDQETERSERKKFHKENTPGDRLGFGPVGYVQSLMWDNFAESPLEMLTPIRPMAKFMHKRTAIEDYVATQLGGSDAAIWTNPYSHFVKPAANKMRLTVDSNFKGKEVVEKENIDEFFDKLDHLRNRMNGSTPQDFDSVIASSMSGLNTKEKVLRFRKNLSDSEKDYFEAFSEEKDETKRNMIRQMLPSHISRGYEQIWRNSDTAETARKRGISVEKAIAEDIHLQTVKLAKGFGVSLTKEEEEAVKHKVYNDRDSYNGRGFGVKERIKYTRDEQIRLKMADQEAYTYVQNSTGVPGKSFMGWDPRLLTDDIKIRTLSAGGEDLKRFGFWKKDEERMHRLRALTDDEPIINNLDAIKASIRKNADMRRQIEMTMFQNGFKPTRISVTEADYGSMRVREE